jgi:hypothetical protein
MNPELVYGNIEDAGDLVSLEEQIPCIAACGITSDPIWNPIVSQVISGYILKKLKLVNNLQPMQRLTFRHRRVSRPKVWWKKKALSLQSPATAIRDDRRYHFSN